MVLNSSGFSTDTACRASSITTSLALGIKYFGIRTFFARLVLIVVAVTFAVVHTLTDFNTDPYSAQAIWGIRIHTALIGLVAVFIAAVLLWKFYDLTPEKMLTIKAKLEEREL
jgi:Na+/melibiose symporter-like transporter